MEFPIPILILLTYIEALSSRIGETQNVQRTPRTFGKRTNNITMTIWTWAVRSTMMGKHVLLTFGQLTPIKPLSSISFEYQNKMVCTFNWHFTRVIPTLYNLNACSIGTLSLIQYSTVPKPIPVPSGSTPVYEVKYFIWILKTGSSN